MTQPPDPSAQEPEPGASATPSGEQAAAPAVSTEAGDAERAAVAAPHALYHDEESGLALPQGVQLASVGRRIGAFFLAIPLSIVTLGIGYAIWGLIVWGRGQTPALQVLGMRCWRPETERVAGWGWMALREIVGRIADGILSIITGLISFILMMTTRERKSLHDYVAGTVVLYDPDKVLAGQQPPAAD